MGDRFTVGGVECFGRRLCEPCAHLDRLATEAGKPGTLRALIHKGGLRADVLGDGEIRVGDVVAARQLRNPGGGRGVTTSSAPDRSPPMRRLVLSAVLLFSLAAASPALGKEVLAVNACGSDGCESTKTADFLRGMTDVGPPTDAPANPAAFYRLNITVGEGHEVAGHNRVSYVPSEGVLLVPDGTWLAVRPEIRSGLDKLTRGLDAIPARKLAGFPADAADASPPAQAPASAPTSTGDDSPIWWILLTAAAALLIGGLIVRSIRIARPFGALD